jgi:hypothetical protein
VHRAVSYSTEHLFFVTSLTIKKMKDFDFFVFRQSCVSLAHMVRDYTNQSTRSHFFMHTVDCIEYITKIGKKW